MNIKTIEYKNNKKKCSRRVINQKRSFDRKSTITFVCKVGLRGESCESGTHMIKVSTPTLQISAGGPTTSPFNISGATRRRRRRKKEKCLALTL